jgi:hypothetical protein
LARRLFQVGNGDASASQVVLASAPAVFDDATPMPKEKRLIDLCRAVIPNGRRVLVYRGWFRYQRPAENPSGAIAPQKKQPGHVSAQAAGFKTICWCGWQDSNPRPLGS